MKRNLWIGVVLVGLNAFVALLTLVWLPLPKKLREPVT